MSKKSYKESQKMTLCTDKIINMLEELTEPSKLFLESINELSEFSNMMNKAEKLIYSGSRKEIEKLSGREIKNEKFLRLYRKLEYYLLNKKRIRFETIKMTHRKHIEKEKECSVSVDEDFNCVLKNNKKYIFKTYSEENPKISSKNDD